MQAVQGCFYTMVAKYRRRSQLKHLQAGFGGELQRKTLHKMFATWFYQVKHLRSGEKQI